MCGFSSLVVAPSISINCDLFRLQDVRETEIDKVEMYKCFRPGDIVRAGVVRDSRAMKSTHLHEEAFADLARRWQVLLFIDGQGRVRRDLCRERRG